MKYFLGVFCAMLLVACGEDTTGGSTVEPEDCTPVDCTPVDCTKPDDAQPIDPDAATGRYDVVATLDLNTCNEDPTGEEFEIGEWFVAMTADEYLFFSLYYGLLFSSTDGVTFTWIDEPSFHDCDSLVKTWTVTLTFDEWGFEGSMNEHILGSQCYDWYTGETIDYDCDYTHSVSGMRQ
ncbi:MAG: hypothetical protein ACXAC5_03795 [Promethearchaeota archaeon]|jgi:hypothetical protein